MVRIHWILSSEPFMKIAQLSVFFGWCLLSSEDLHHFELHAEQPEQVKWSHLEQTVQSSPLCAANEWNWKLLFTKWVTKIIIIYVRSEPKKRNLTINWRWRRRHTSGLQRNHCDGSEEQWRCPANSAALRQWQSGDQVSSHFPVILQYHHLYASNDGLNVKFEYNVLHITNYV